MSAEDFFKGLELSKYVNFASPVAAGWGATVVYDKSAIVGMILVVYVVVWCFTNATGFVVTMVQNYKKIRRGAAPDEEKAPAPE